jgi:hypothetical protein
MRTGKARRGFLRNGVRLALVAGGTAMAVYAVKALIAMASGEPGFARSGSSSLDTWPPVPPATREAAS